MTSSEPVYTFGPITFSHSQLLYVSCLVASYFFSYAYYLKLLNSKSEWLKYVYIIGVSNLFLFLNFPLLDVLTLYFPIVVTYMVALCFRKFQPMPLWNFVFLLTYLAWFHSRRQFLEDSSPDRYVLDITGPLMMLVIKLSSFAFDTRDSYVWLKKRLPQLHDSNLLHCNRTGNNESIPASSKASKEPVIETARKFIVLQTYPTLLEFLGYSLLFPGLLTGPTLPFYEFRTFISGSYFAEVDTTKGSLVGRKRRASYLFFMSLFFMTIYACFNEPFSPKYLASTEFATMPFWKRLVFTHAMHMVSRSKYYFAWLVAEGSYVIIGLGLRTAPSMKPIWDRLENVNPFRIESNTDFKLLISQWNQCTNQWLHSYVYRRLQKHYGKDSSSARASVITYLVSAFWHGFYPGYYLSFVTAAMMTVATRCILDLISLPYCVVIYKSVNWPFGSLSRRIIVFLPLQVVIDYIATPFVLLDFKRSISYWRGCYFYGHLFMALSILVLVMFERHSNFKKKLL